MAIINDGKDLVVGLLLGNSTETIVNGGFGVDDATAMTDTNIQGSVVTLDLCESTTGWSAVADALTPSSDTSNYREGSASIKGGTTYSTGDAHYTKTITSVDMSGTNDKVYLFVYVEDITDLDNVSNAVYLELGTGGFTNSNTYNFARTSLSNGWNALIKTVSSPDSTNGTGADESDIDSVKIGFTSGNTIAGGDLKFDYIRGVVDGGFGISDSLSAFTATAGSQNIKITHKALATESVGYDLSSAALSGTTTLFAKSSFTAINKNDDTEVQADWFILIE